MARKARIYVDTSVFGGMSDPEFSEVTSRFFAEVRIGLHTILSPREVISNEEGL